MKKCAKCGKENIDEARFCTWCRAELPVTVEKKKNNSGRIIAIVIPAGPEPIMATLMPLEGLGPSVIWLAYVLEI